MWSSCIRWLNSWAIDSTCCAPDGRESPLGARRGGYPFLMPETSSKPPTSSAIPSVFNAFMSFSPMSVRKT
jgi:hypothetical protein